MFYQVLKQVKCEYNDIIVKIKKLIKYYFLRYRKWKILVRENERGKKKQKKDSNLLPFVDETNKLPNALFC